MSAEDTAMLDGLERNIIQEWESFSVEFTRVALPGSGSGRWKVSFKSDMKSEKRSVLSTGGGATLREALTNAFVDRIATRLER